MKKLLSLILLACTVFTLAACNAPVEKEYSLAVVVDYTFSGTKGTNVVGAIVFDKDGKIAAARFDSIEESLKLSEVNELATVDSVATKVEQGEAYGGTEAANDYAKMPAGSWERQAAAFEAAIIGKNAAEVEAFTAETVAGCTMKSTVPMFVNIVKKAAAYDAKVSFKTSSDITLGLGVNGKISGSIADGATADIDYAAVVLADGKVAACMLDSSQNKYTLTVADGALTASGEYKGTKNDQGEAYGGTEAPDNAKMPAGSWKKQAQAFADSVVGKTTAELDSMEVTSDAIVEAGCTMRYTVGGYKTVIIEAASKAK